MYFWMGSIYFWMGIHLLAIVICSVIILERDFSDRALEQFGTGVDEYGCMVREVLQLFPKGRKAFNSLNPLLKCVLQPDA